jgi:hypothetical protein
VMKQIAYVDDLYVDRLKIKIFHMIEMAWTFLCN